MKKILLSIFFALLVQLAWSQVVSTNPVFPSADQPVTITVDVSGTSLDHFAWNNDTNPVWIWTWISEVCSSNCDAPTNVDPATSAQNAAKATRISTNPDKYQITFTPTTFFNRPVSELKKIGLKLKSRAWADKKETDNDKFITLTSTFSVGFTQPSVFPIFRNQNEQIAITANASQNANLTLTVNGSQVASASGVNVLNYTHTISEAYGVSEVIVIADNGSEVKESSFTYVVRKPVENAVRPAGVIDGINYGADATKVRLSLWAPAKTSVYVRGDFNNWQIDPQYQMKKDGEHFWIELTGLTAGVEYAYQYLVDENIWIADPYSDKVLDPEDSFIPASTYPSLKQFPAAALSDKSYFNRVSVFQTNQTPYAWQVTEFQKPAKKDLVIYELLVRDFFADGQRNYQNLIDTISYFKRLGINAIELMPITEFNGNDSWGYNPTFMFAPDKYYGTRNKLKEFIDKCHAEGIAVILDIVMNQQDIPNPYVLMDFDFTALPSPGKPSVTNKWFNRDATHPFNVFFDMNHESSYTKEYLDTVNYYWMHEYKVDGFRFDLSKGFTQTNNPNDVGAWSAKDDSRIAILKRMANEIWGDFPDAYLILEHLADNDEEKILADFGFMLWGNMNGAYSQASMGFSENSDLARTFYKSRNWNEPNLVSYMESHDEERMMYRNLQFGNSNGTYSVKNLSTALDRIKAAATFFFSVPGPKMFWQFGELGYDVSIESGGRTSAKPVKWEYYEQPDRIELYNHFAELINFRNEYSIFQTSDVAISGGNSLIKQLTLKNTPFNTNPQLADEMNVQVAVNFDVSPKTVQVNFSHPGTWYDYYKESSPVTVSGASLSVLMKAGEYKLYTDYPLSEPPVTGIDEDVMAMIQPFPNPTRGDITLPQTDLIYSVSIIDLAGIEHEVLLNEGKLRTSNLPAGLYTIKIDTSRGFVFRKFVKL